MNLSRELAFRSHFGTQLVSAIPSSLRNLGSPCLSVYPACLQSHREQGRGLFFGGNAAISFCFFPCNFSLFAPTAAEGSALNRFPVAPLSATLTGLLVSVDSERLTVTLTPLSATLTKKWGGARRSFSPNEEGSFGACNIHLVLYLAHSFGLIRSSKMSIPPNSINLYDLFTLCKKHRGGWYQAACQTLLWCRPRRRKGLSLPAATGHGPRITGHGSRLLPPYPPVLLHPSPQGAKMTSASTPHRETSPLLPVSKQVRADTGPGIRRLPYPVASRSQQHRDRTRKKAWVLRSNVGPISREARAS